MNIEEQYFTCKKCGESKIWGDFVKRAKGRNGIGTCKSCKKKYERERRKIARVNGSSTEKEYAAFWRAKNPNLVKNYKRKQAMSERQYLKVRYVKKKLKRIGFDGEQIAQNPELINIQRIIIQTKRLCKT